jgi:hypothetical protein
MPGRRIGRERKEIMIASRRLKGEFYPSPKSRVTKEARFFIFRVP